MRRAGMESPQPCAGKSEIADSSWRVVVGNHPRVRGEKPPNATTSSVLRESLPHARGRVDELRKVVTPTGITPACAGKRFHCDSVAKQP